MLMIVSSFIRFCFRGSKGINHNELLTCKLANLLESKLGSGPISNVNHDLMMM